MSEPGQELTVSADRHWAAAMTMLAAADDLYVEVCRSECDPVVKAAARTALMSCMEIIRLNPLRTFGQDWRAMYWAGLIEGAMRVITEIEQAMRPEGTREQR